jgi:hypothetical protein
MNPSTSSNVEAAGGSATFKVSTRQLGADLTTVGAELNACELGQLTAAQLSDALAKLALITPDKMLDADPRLVVAGRRGRFIIRPKRGKFLLFDATDASRAPLEINGDEVPGYLNGSEIKAGSAAAEDPSAVVITETKSRTGLLIAAMLLSVGVLGASAYLTFFQTPSFDKEREYTAPPPEQLVALRPKFVGVFTTGKSDNLRELTLRPEGTVQLVEYGPNGTIADQREDTYQVMLHEGKTPTARTRWLGPIELRDAKTITYAGETYTRNP